MIDASRAAGALVIIAEMRIPPNYGMTYTERFNAMFHELAEQESVTLLPFLLQDVALEPGMMQADGIHPTAAAQPVILDAVWNVLQPMLQ
jgi:acyl-CoA thioesterase-1